MRHKYALVAALTLSLLAGCATCPSGTSKWEYKLVEGKVFGNEKRLDVAINNYVADGWDLFSPIHYGGDDYGWILLRRPRK